MSNFDEADVERDAAGRFGEKTHGAPEAVLSQATQLHESEATAETALASLSRRHSETSSDESLENIYGGKTSAANAGFLDAESGRDPAPDTEDEQEISAYMAAWSAHAAADDTTESGSR